MAVKLSARMSALAALVTPGVRLADVGTDHGYIPVFLCQTGVIPSAIAMDINCGPLQRAEAHVAEFGLGDRIETRLSDGLEKLLPGEADCVLIAGMGGGLIQRILSEGETVLQSVGELILQPQSEIPQTRRFLREHGYQIAEEDMVEEDGKFYFLMKAHKQDRGEDASEKETAEPPEQFCAADSGGNMADTDADRRRLEDEFGPVLLRKKHPVLLRWVRREMRIVLMIRRKLWGAMYETEEGDLRFAVHEPGAAPEEAGCQTASGAGNGTDTEESSSGRMDKKQERLFERLAQAEERWRLLAEADRLLQGAPEKTGNQRS